MCKHRERVQMKRKRHAKQADNAHAQLIAIYERATQGGSDGYLTRNQKSDPSRVIAQAEDRRRRRGVKERVLRPRAQGTVSQAAPKPTRYQQLKSGQIVGYPRLMREVKQEARQSRLTRRTAFRSGVER